MSNSIKGFVRTTAASLTMASTVLSLAGFAAFAPVAAYAVAPADFGLTEGDTIRATGDVDIFIVNAHGYKRLFVNPAIFNLYGHLGWANVKEVSPSVRDAFGTSGYFTNAEANDGKVYALECVSSDVANLHWLNLSGAQAVAQDANFFQKVFNINNNEVALYGMGSAYTALGAASGCAAAGATPTPGSGGLNGGAGSLEDADFISSLNNEEVGEGESNVKVAGLELDADNGSDLRILSSKIILVHTGTAGSDDLDDYAENVSLWYGSSKVGEVDADDFNEDSSGTWSKSISLSGDAVIPMDGSGMLYVAVSAHQNIDSTDLSAANNDWTVEFDSVRYVDAQGAITTEDGASALGDIGDTRAFEFASFGTAADLELKLSESSSNPEAQVIEVDDESGTDGVVLAVGTLKATGGDITVKELTVTVASTGADLDEIASSITLEIDGDEVQTLDSDECNGLGECVFDDVDKDIDEGDTVTVRVLADVNGTDDHAEGTTLTASIDNSDTVAEDMNGDDLDSANDQPGALNGEAQAFYSEGIKVSKVSATAERTLTADAASEVDNGTYTFVFDVTAFGDDVYLDRSIDDNSTVASGSGVSLQTSSSSTGTVTSSSFTFEAAGTESLDDSDAFYVAEGDTRRFTATVIYAAATDGSREVVLQRVNWDTATCATSSTAGDCDGSSTVGGAELEEQYSFNFSDDFKSGLLFLNVF